MMIYLTFATEAEAMAVLYDGEVPRYPGLEILNQRPMPVCRATGEADAEGSPVMAPVPGCHVNAVGPCPKELESWRVYPATPFAVLAE